MGKNGGGLGSDQPQESEQMLNPQEKSGNGGERAYRTISDPNIAKAQSNSSGNGRSLRDLLQD